MRINVVLTLLKKEFLNIIRDKKSFIIMILLPLLIFPLTLGLSFVLMNSITTSDLNITLGVNYQVTEDFKKYADTYYADYEIKYLHEDEKSLKEKFDNEEISIYVTKENNEYILHYDVNDTGAFANSAVVENLYKDYQEHYIEEILKSYNLDYNEIKDSFKVTHKQESITEMGSSIPSIISMLLMMMITTTCISVAIDITTSEKEKGTLETILSLPTKKSEIVTSKYLTVFSLSAMSGFLTYLSLFVTLFFTKDFLTLFGIASISVDISVLLIYLLAIILLSLLCSGLLLSITIFSKNLKEAQNTLYPLEILVSLVSFVPMLGIGGESKYAIVPLVNVAILFNNALASNIDLTFVILTLLSTLVYAILLILIVSRLYNQEDILFNSKSLSYLTFKNGQQKSNGFSIVSAILIAVIVYLLSSYFSIIFINTSKYLLIAIMPLTILLVIFVSSLLVNLDYKESFKINTFSIKKAILLLLLYISSYFLINYIIQAVTHIFPNIVKDYSVVESFIRMDNLLISLLLTALAPAIAEELLFRAVVYNSFNKKYGYIIAIIISAASFGIYHMNWVQGISASLMGLILGYSYYKTNSIFMPMILHFANNTFAVIANHFNILDFTIPIYGHIILIISSILFTILLFIILERKNVKET